MMKGSALAFALVLLLGSAPSSAFEACVCKPVTATSATCQQFASSCQSVYGGSMASCVSGVNPNGVMCTASSTNCGASLCSEICDPFNPGKTGGSYSCSANPPGDFPSYTCTCSLTSTDSSTVNCALLPEYCPMKGMCTATTAQCTFPGTDTYCDPLIIGAKPCTEYCNQFGFPVGSLQCGSGSSSGLSTGAIAGIVVGSVAGVLLIAVLAFFFYRRRRNAYQTLGR